MQCYSHPQRGAVSICANCGKGLCSECSVDVDGKTYCQNCLSTGNLPQRRDVIHKPTNPLAIVSLALGILGLCGGLPFAAGAWITGRKAIAQIEQASTKQGGLELARIGQGLGIAATILYGAVLLCVLAMYSLGILGSILQQ